MNSPTKKIQRLHGVIVSQKTAKTAIVLVRSTKVHRKYHKRYMVTRKYPAHDEQNQFHLGDHVEIVPCRPMSRTKRFMITKKL
ncbi:MAG: 30S ribosomal protein S17 [Candidatus Doudnabacteria bacterium RIFCSPHIGHO2_01_FULL_50_11]|uniref:30S ribosomal protein S17 n=1 Tax=Candidatus Doudnabacteria bacterium RIFCSPHIGHO2_01_FULL_50_11 TaxID=1817828 RepID=A0A1F5PMV2_9BACT|nr:ribosomal protein S17 [uncultured bacterium]OGE91268.1 MAG: 30S ribosomal protein S17 [Candidatus Doudnabacteria bacterium RIFCSPHIGHO2_01_FULL_50_11]